ncbi:FAD-binding and (Fe-S)-binding domain-containing protein [Compostibacter hankyongensis]
MKPENKSSAAGDTRFMTRAARGVDVRRLEALLKANLSGEVRFDAGSRALYATDSSNYRQVPIGVVIPKSETDIIHTVAACRKYHAPLLMRGGGTSLAGQGCNVAVVLDTTKYYNRVLELDKTRKTVRVQTGIVLDHMLKATRREGLVFGPDPATHNHCSIGGMLGNNSCGIHSVMAAHAGYGARMSDNTASLSVLTYDGIKMEVGPTGEQELEAIIRAGGRRGDIYRQLRDFRDKYADLIRERFPDIPRRVSGYNLPALLPENGFNVAAALVGSECTCVTILEATLKLMEEPPARSLLVLGYPDIFTAGRQVPRVMQHKPIGLEGIDDRLLKDMQEKGLNLEDLELLPEGKGWLLVEFGADTKAQADEAAKQLMEALGKEEKPPVMSLFDDPAQEKMLWEIRESGLGATAWVHGKPDSWPGWEDSAVPPEKVGDYLEELRALFSSYGYEPSLYGHFGQGCIHCRVGFDLFSQEGLQRYKKFTEAAARLVLKYGGSISGEHGDGQARGDLLEIMYGKEMVQAFREFKAIWDPQGKMNPGKIVDTYGQLSNLRVGTHYQPANPETFFHFPAEGSFSRAALRCVGVGNCRRSEGGTMCPSYMATYEEEHSTRGRARMLFEMLQGQVVTRGWKDKYVKKSLDLCLSCKGCKHDCPVNVDMATYKSEFLFHYYKGRLRPRSAYAFGLIHWWSRLASQMPELVNGITQSRVLAPLVKLMTGVAPERSLPRFAAQPFRKWFTQQERKKSDRPRVILWTDTFNNFFLPETLVAGAEVLEAAGFRVVIPRRQLCCGRPLYDFGMLHMARGLLQQILGSLRREIRAGTPVVGLEPSCVAVFRDELCNLLPYNEDARRLRSQTYTLAEFLEKKAPHFQLPAFKRKALLHGHCHHKAIMQLDTDEKVLRHMQLDYQLLDSGCCGMAGYFGYEKGAPYQVSVRAGENVLLPAVRKASKDTLIIADGFSCREQIRQLTDRGGLHTAQVIRMALDGKDAAAPYPERRYAGKLKSVSANHLPRLLAGAAIAGIGVFLLAGRLLRK